MNIQMMGTSGICDDDSDKRYRIIKEVKDITYTNVCLRLARLNLFFAFIVRHQVEAAEAHRHRNVP